jgi:integrase
VNGTIHKRQKANGRPSWAYIFDAGKDPEGKRRQITKSGYATKAEASEALRVAIAAEEAKRNEKPVAIVPTFEAFLDRWLKEHASRVCSPKTLEAYTQHGAYAIREFGTVPLDELDVELLETGLNRLHDSGGKNGRPLSAKTVRHISFVISGCLSKAVKWKLITTNPMAHVERPKLVKTEPRVLDSAGLKTLFDRAHDTRLYPLLVVAASTGCRRGELLALQWSDLNFKTGAVTISKSLEETKAGLRVKSTKSKKPREFPVPAAALTILEFLRDQQAEERKMYGDSYEDNNLVFCRQDGAYLRPDQMSVRVTDFARRAGLKGIGLHSLRHSHASQLISSGVPSTAVASRLGHANAAITLSIYSHALPADETAAATIWNNAVADVIQTERSSRPARMLANVSGNHIKRKQVDETKDSDVVGAAGLEPATPDLEGRCSIQMSYAPALVF